MTQTVAVTRARHEVMHKPLSVRSCQLSTAWQRPNVATLLTGYGETREESKNLVQVHQVLLWSMHGILGVLTPRASRSSAVTMTLTEGPPIRNGGNCLRSSAKQEKIGGPVNY